MSQKSGSFWLRKQWWPKELDFFTSELDLKKVPKKSPTPTAKSPTAIPKSCWTWEYSDELEFSSPFMEQWTLDARGVLMSLSNVHSSSQFASLAKSVESRVGCEVFRSARTSWNTFVRPSVGKKNLDQLYSSINQQRTTANLSDVVWCVSGGVWSMSGGVWISG